MGSLWYLWILWYASYTCNTKWIFDLISAYFKWFLNEHSCRLHQRLDIVKDMFTELFAQQDWSLNYSNSWYTVMNVWDHQEENVSLIFLYIWSIPAQILKFCSYILCHEAVLKIYCNIYNMLLMEKIFWNKTKTVVLVKKSNEEKNKWYVCRENKVKKRLMNTILGEYFRIPCGNV